MRLTRSINSNKAIHIVTGNNKLAAKKNRSIKYVCGSNKHRSEKICLLKWEKTIKDHISQTEFQNSFYSFQNHFRIEKY